MVKIFLIAVLVLLAGCEQSPQFKLQDIEREIAEHRAAIRDIEATRMLRPFEQAAFEHRIADDPKTITAMRKVNSDVAPHVRAAENEVLAVHRKSISALEIERDKLKGITQ